MSHVALPVAVLSGVGNLSAELVVILLLVVVASLAGGGIGVWRLFGVGPRRQRAFRRARARIHEGDWQAAQSLLEGIRGLGAVSPDWAGQLNNLDGECRRAAAEAALAQRDFETALERHLAAAALLHTNPAEARARVVDAMLADLYRDFAAGNNEAAVRFAERILRLDPGCAEASFWRGLLHLRLHRPELAETAFRTALETGDKKAVDATLYLGMLLVREGKTKDGLRYLADANRAAPNSPLVSWQLGTGLAVGGGDAALALHALQKAAGPDGLPHLAPSPATFWLEALPEGSWIGKLARNHVFDCPILGGNFLAMVRQARIALAQAFLRQDRTSDAVGIYQELVNEAEPTPALLRSLGIGLSRLERFDDAYMNLKLAYDREEAKSPLTACYLAYCAARSRPNRPDDRPANVRWAVRLLGDLAFPLDLDAVRCAAGAFAEARTLEVPVPVTAQVRLCDTLVALDAADALAAGAYDHLAASQREAMRPAYAFRYARAALAGYRGQCDLELFEELFKQPAEAELYFRGFDSNLARVERLYLERWAEQRQGFPPVFGPEYPAKCEQKLLEEFRVREAAGDKAAAHAAIDLLRRLIPPNAATYDQLARLAWYRGDVDEAVRLLQQWQAQSPDQATPHVRLAALESGRSRHEVALEHNREALQRTSGAARGHVAYLGARVALKAKAIDVALSWLHECLSLCPDHARARWLLAALLWQSARLDELATEAPAMRRPDVADPRFQYLAAVCLLHAGDLEAARLAVLRAQEHRDWEVDSAFLLGVIDFRRRDISGAERSLNLVVQVPDSPCVDGARALLGRASWEHGGFGDAVGLLQSVSEKKRQAWGLDQFLAGLNFLAGVQAVRGNAPGDAARFLSRARELGWRDPSLPALQEWAVLHAARQELDSHEGKLSAAHAAALDRISRQRGNRQWPAALLLARGQRRSGDTAAARAVLRRPGPPSPAALLELGLSAIQEHQLSQAEEAFARVLQAEKDHPVAALNLFWTRLSLGQTDLARAQLASLIQHARSAEEGTLLNHLQALLAGGSGAVAGLADLTPEEETRLIDMFLKLGRLETAVPLLCVLAAARPNSPAVKEAQWLGMARLGKQSFERGDWLGAEKWLSPLAKARPSAGVRNLLGIAACLTQDFGSGILHLQEAQRLAGDDPRIHQNLALAFTWQGDHAEADLCWGRYLGTMDKNLPRPPGFIDYHERLRCQALKYLGNLHYDQARWTEALAYLEQAQKLQPDNLELTERLFLLQLQAGHRTDARKTLDQLKQLKPRHGPFEIYELDLIEVRSGDDLETLLETLGRLVEQVRDDAAAQEKAVVRVVPMLQFRSDELTRQLREIRDDLRRLDDDSPGWYDALRDLRSVKRHLRRLRQVVRYCAAFPIATAPRRTLDGLNEELDRKIDYCRRWEDEE